MSKLRPTVGLWSSWAWPRQVGWTPKISVACLYDLGSFRYDTLLPIAFRVGLLLPEVFWELWSRKCQDKNQCFWALLNLD